jgi:hypothetical protein
MGGAQSGAIAGGYRRADGLNERAAGAFDRTGHRPDLGELIGDLGALIVHILSLTHRQATCA